MSSRYGCSSSVLGLRDGTSGGPALNGDWGTVDSLLGVRAGTGGRAAACVVRGWDSGRSS